MIVAHAICVLFKMINTLRPQYQWIHLKKLTILVQFFVYMGSIIFVSQKFNIIIGREANLKLVQFRLLELMVFYLQIFALAIYLVICKIFVNLYDISEAKKAAKAKEEIEGDDTTTTFYD